LAKLPATIGAVFMNWRIDSIEGLKYACTNLECAHTMLKSEWMLRYQASCKPCADEKHKAKDLIGKTTGTFVCIAETDQRRNGRTLYVVQCQVCKTEEMVTSVNLTEGKARRCRTCKKLAYEQIRANPRLFTDEEAKTILLKIRKGVRTIGVPWKETCSHTNLYTNEDECIQAAFAELLECDLSGVSLDKCCALACGIAKNCARRVYNKCSLKFKDSILNDDGEYVSPLDTVPVHEPDYEYETAETTMDKDTLHEELNALTSEERSLLLSDVNNLPAESKTAYTLLVTRLKNTLTSPCCQIQPL
jgi:hypothetical protein